MQLPDLKHKKVLIMGLGLNGGGLASARFFAESGAQVTVTDLKSETELAPSIKALTDLNIRYVLGKHHHDDFADADIVVPNPIVKKDNPFLQTALQAGAKLQTDLHFFLENTPSPVIGVTGTRGKSTTCSLLHHLLNQEKTSFLGGNITISPLTFWQQLSAETPVVLELSSWQLRWLADADFTFTGFVFTNFLRDHQNHYKDLESYWNEKKIALQKLSSDSFLVFNGSQSEMADFPNLSPAKIYQHSLPNSNIPSIWPEDGSLWQQKPHSKRHCIWQDLASLPLKGLPHWQNIAAAVLAAQAMGISLPSIQESLPHFQGVPFRQEPVAAFGDMHFINDTTSTTPEAAIAALEAFPNPLICILGGADKSLQFNELAQKILQKNPKFIAFLEGSGTTALLKALEPHLNELSFQLFTSFSEATNQIEHMAKPGDTILLSPGCASFGMFQNEFDRGRQFNAWITQWKDRFERKELL